MSKIKNRIITISGEPASGKGTVVNKLKENYEEQGYNVHIFSVGHEFRRIAQEKGLSIEQLNEYMAKRGSIDKLIDSTVEQRGKEINSKSREDDIYIFDSRLAFNNIPDSFSIRLTVDDRVAGERVFGDNKRGKEDKYNNLEEAIEKTHNRKISEVERYKKRYGIDLQDINNYNLVVDTSFSSIEDITQLIEQCLELELERGKLEEELLSLREGRVNVNNKLERIQQIQQRIGKTRYGKMWTSPKKLLPLQRELDTLGMGFGSSLTLDQFIEKLRKEGYNPDSEIQSISVNNRLYIIEGHHRNFASGYLGKTLVPYYILAKDDEKMIGYGNNTARQRSMGVTRDMLWGHEQFFDKPGEQFSYNHIYPGIYDELTKREQEDIWR